LFQMFILSVVIGSHSCYDVRQNDSYANNECRANHIEDYSTITASVRKLNTSEYSAVISSHSCGDVSPERFLRQ